MACQQIYTSHIPNRWEYAMIIMIMIIIIVIIMILCHNLIGVLEGVVHFPQFCQLQL